MKRLRAWFGDRSAESIAPQDIEHRFAIRDGKVSANPARATKHRKEDNDRVRYLTADEESRLREVLAAEWPEHIPEVDLALHTGMRRSEMYGLDWEDVDLERVKPFLRVKRGKNGESRYVRLNSIAVKALKKLKERSDGTGAVIRNLCGTPLLAPRHWFPDAVKKAGIENFHWHDLWHTFASRLAMAGVPLPAIAEALGHKSIAMTMRYAHLAPDYMADAVEKLVPVEAEAPTTEVPIATDTRTDTRTDTEALASLATANRSVH